MKIVIAFITLMVVVSAKEQFFKKLEKGKHELTQELFNHYDSDKNGVLVFSEFKLFYKDAKVKAMEKRALRVIKSCDKNGNGTIELSEVPSIEDISKIYENGKIEYSCKQIDKDFFKIIDKDKNNIVTKDEYIKFLLKPKKWTSPKKMSELDMFKYKLKNFCDINKDGNITLKEATSLRCFIDSDTFIKYSGGADKSFKISDVKSAPKDDTEELAEHMLKECDKNGDLKLTLVEATSRWCKMFYEDFVRLDKNKDNILSKSEFAKRYDFKKSNSKPSIEDVKNYSPSQKVTFAYNACDYNADNKLSKKEAKECKLPIKIFKKYDYDKNSYIGQNDIELIKIHSLFKRTDTNNNSKIDFNEFIDKMANVCVVF